MNHMLYLLHSQLDEFRALVKRTRSYIAKRLKTGKWYVSVSGGKDSSVLWHLVCSVAPTPGAFGYYYVVSEQWPDAIRVVEEIGRKMGAPLYIVDIPGGGNREISLEEWARLFFRAWQVFVDQHGFTGHFMGLRREESIGRRMLLAKRRTYKRKSDGLWVCCPLAEWSGRDVWAYILSHELPYLSFYESAPDPERARSDVYVTPYLEQGAISLVKKHSLSHYNWLMRESAMRVAGW